MVKKELATELSDIRSSLREMGLSSIKGTFTDDELSLLDEATTNLSSVVGTLSSIEEDLRLTIGIFGKLMSNEDNLWVRKPLKAAVTVLEDVLEVVHVKDRDLKYSSPSFQEKSSGWSR